MQVEVELKKEKYGRAIGKIPSGVYVLTCERRGEKHGVLMTWIAQASFEPPLLSIAIKADRPILADLSVGSALVVNVLSKTNMNIFKNFAKPDLSRAERFAGLSLAPENVCGPVFSQALAYMNCTVCRLVESGDHMLVLAEVIGGEILEPEAEPMTHLRKSGFQY